MNTKASNILSLDNDMVAIESDALSSEQNNAATNYSYLSQKIQQEKDSMPYKNTSYRPIDYEDRDQFLFEKAQNKPYWDRIDHYEKYAKSGSLYSGHLQTAHGSDYYILDSALLETLRLDRDHVFINADDKNYSEIINSWRYPSQHHNVTFSRNITMENKKVTNVDVVFDNSSELYSNITDSYLRNALIRNKNQSSIQSIIQTIQSKQDRIRTLEKNHTFAVQGCAGSGKTMVLLHRLRYLLYNKDIDSSDFVFLMPSKEFKDYISEISSNFKISYNNMYSYSEYYQMLSGKLRSNIKTTVNELVFPDEFLLKVYSEDFIKEVYHSLIDVIVDQSNKLIAFCEHILTQITEDRNSFIENQIAATQENAFKEIVNLTIGIQNNISVKLNNYDDIEPFTQELLNIYTTFKNKFDDISSQSQELDISADDERLTSNPELKQLEREIIEEEEQLERASIFTILAHKNKLKSLNEKIDTLYNSIVARLLEEDKRSLALKASEFSSTIGNLSLDDLESITLRVSNACENYKALIQKYLDLKANMIDSISKELETPILKLNEFIVRSPEVAEDTKSFIDSLKPLNGYLDNYISLGTDILNDFEQQSVRSKFEKELKSIRLFSTKTDIQSQAYLNTLMFNICKKKLKEDFNMLLSDNYKHYWYLSLYCQYLTRKDLKGENYYIFVDEAQDLSLAELNLIYNINYQSQDNTCYPIMNLFGDVNQTLTEYGIKDWKNLSYIQDEYILDENFRNTNQIVDYCNSKLSIKMKKVGVDMHNVEELESIESLIKSKRSSIKEYTFIVKNEHSVEDLKTMFSQHFVENNSIFTVKDVKGVEFRDVYVIDRDMSANEKYISYTRALSQLHIIHNMPYTTSQAKSFIIAGEDTPDSLD